MSRSKTNNRKTNMNKTTRILGAVLFTATILMSCGSSMESDAKKVAEISMKSIKASGSISTEESLNNAQLIAEFEQKYSSPVDKKKFEEMVEKELTAAMATTK
jgi:preprotein translocase subunit SecG